MNCLPEDLDSPLCDDSVAFQRDLNTVDEVDRILDRQIDLAQQIAHLQDEMNDLRRELLDIIFKRNKK